MVALYRGAMVTGRSPWLGARTSGKSHSSVFAIVELSSLGLCLPPDSVTWSSVWRFMSMLAAWYRCGCVETSQMQVHQEISGVSLDMSSCIQHLPTSFDSNARWMLSPLGQPQKRGTRRPTGNICRLHHIPYSGFASHLGNTSLICVGEQLYSLRAKKEHWRRSVAHFFHKLYKIRCVGLMPLEKWGYIITEEQMEKCRKKTS